MGTRFTFPGVFFFSSRQQLLILFVVSAPFAWPFVVVPLRQPGSAPESLLPGSQAPKPAAGTCSRRLGN